MTVKLTLLLDLDGTLLVNEMEGFLSAYMKALSTYVKPLVEPTNLVNTLLAATQKMIANNLPDRTLKEVFDESFYPSLNIREEEVRETFESFYQEIFPSLRGYTQQIPEAVKLVDEALSRGYQVGIATNPLFPKTAILQRIAWAGINLDDDDIALVPSYETFSFSKPNPTFYTEFLAKMGWPDGPVVMIGNDLEADILPARKIGIKTFYTPEDGAPLPLNYSEYTSPGGNIEDVIPWIDSLAEEELLPDFSSPESLMAILRATPAAIHTLAQQLPEKAWTYCPKPGEWCLAEITCHLRDVDAEVNKPRIQKILDEVEPFLPGMDTDSWVSEREYIVQDCTEALEVFTQNRINLLSMLEEIKPEDWSRKAKHSIFGPTQLQEMVNIITQHDRLHIRQVYNTIPTIGQ
jgi:FMN phosphatase YigB (HAD superfamily)